MENIQNGFCPKCGALMRDGVCQSCGSEKEAEGEANYYTPLVTPQPAADFRAMKEQRNAQAQAGHPMYGAPEQLPQNEQLMYGAPEQLPQNEQPMYGAPEQLPNYGSGNGMSPTGGMPPTGGIPPMYRIPQDNQKKNSNVAIVIVCIIAVLVAVFVVLAGIFAEKSIEKFKEELRSGVAWTHENGSYENGSYENGSYENGFFENDPYEEVNPYDEIYKPKESEKNSDYGITPDALYYEGLTDSIDYDTDYSISFEEYVASREEEDQNLDYQIYYVLLEGEQIPNLEKLNEQLEYYSKWYVDSVAREQAENGVECFITSYAYVTYNDEQKISIVLSESVHIGDEYMIGLYPINIDLVNGKVLKNTEMINVDGAFAKDFRERSIRQNGDSFPDITDEEIYNYMKDEDSLIVFYTPVGLEVGINYEEEYGYNGWITVTYKDYQSFLSISG